MEEEFIHKKIDAAMRSIDNIKRASPRPYLFTRLEARMQNEKNIWTKVIVICSKAGCCFCMYLFYINTKCHGDFVFR